MFYLIAFTARPTILKHRKQIKNYNPEDRLILINAKDSYDYYLLIKKILRS